MRCEEPVKIIEIIRLWEQGYSQREIAASVKCAKSTVGEVQRRCREHSLTYSQASNMTDDTIKATLYPDSFAKRYVKDEPNWESIHARLVAHKRQNLQFLWEDYRAGNPDGLGYSQFCKRYTLWRNETGKDVIMVQTHEPGKELFVDWMGDTLSCVVDPETGEMLTAHFFVATLGDSGYPYVEAFADEKLENWLSAHVHTLEWLQGVPRVIVPDNCKTAVSKPGYYDPQLNPAYWDLARHYDVAVIPARIRSPRDKGQVESSVGWLETWLLEWLRPQRFFTFEELNRAIVKRLKELVKRPFRKRAGSRESVFQAVDRPALRPLPSTRYEYTHYIVRRVPDNYHVEFEGFYYSVPHRLFKHQVTLRITATLVEILSENRERVALHHRQYRGSRYVTTTEHMPDAHRHQQEANRYKGDDYRQWAQLVGEHTECVIDTLLRAQHVEETAYRACMGLLQMGKRYGQDRLEAACKRSRELGSCTYSTVKTILKNGQDKGQSPSPVKPTPVHSNLRGAAAFR